MTEPEDPPRTRREAREAENSGVIPTEQFPVAPRRGLPRRTEPAAPEPAEPGPAVPDVPAAPSSDAPSRRPRSTKPLAAAFFPPSSPASAAPPAPPVSALFPRSASSEGVDPVPVAPDSEPATSEPATSEPATSEPATVRMPAAETAILPAAAATELLTTRSGGPGSGGSDGGGFGGGFGGGGSGGDGGSDGPPSGRGAFLATFAEHPRAWLIAAAAIVFVLLGTGSLFAGRAVGATESVRSAGGSTASAKPSVTPTPTPTPRVTPSGVAAPTALRTCSVAAAAADGRLGTFSGTVINSATGEVLFDRNGSTATPTASVMKTLTASAALATLGPSYRFTTKVYAGTEPGSIVLVGGGDPTLSRVSSSVYSGAPRLSDLATQTVAAWKALHPDDPITKVILDATLWDPNDNWDPSWPANERTLGYQPLITALMVDGDRANPAAQNSPRSLDPVGVAGSAFVAALSAAGATDVSAVKAGSAAEAAAATDSATALGSVSSQPISTLIGQMLPVSDNTLAEMMVRLVSVTTGGGGSQASLATKIPAALAAYGIPTTGLVIKDGSGESNKDGVPPTYAAQLMVKIGAGGQNLGIIYGALPVSGRTGTLASRFTGANAVARGAVNAKTGSIANLYALSGIIHSADGTALAFAFFAGGRVTASGAMGGLDSITTAVFRCGNNLSNR
ncbi:hypothetical protein BH09ACT1_BH09ACT1_14860 [soil metagenome]